MDNPIRLTGKMTLKFENRPNFWGLVLGGAQIPPFISPWAFLLDSNAVTRLKAVAKMLPPEKGWWETILANHETLLNPLPFAMEGGAGNKIPTREEFEARFRGGVTHLSGIGNASVVNYEASGFDDVYAIVEDIAATNQAENKFLVEISPRIKPAINPTNWKSREDEIFECAKRHGLSLTSLSLLSALSCLYRSQEPVNPAERVLKPGKIENDGHAYNALADLSLLRLFIASLGYASMANMPRFALLTADIQLRNLWMGLEISDPHFEGNHGVATYSISTELFPLETEERIRLMERLQSL